MAGELEGSEPIITEEELAEHFEEIAEKLRAQHQTALISRGGEVVARLVPVYEADEAPEEG